MRERATFRDRSGRVAAEYAPEYLSRGDADGLMRSLLDRRKSFKSGFMLVGDLWVKTPRLVAEFGEEEHVYPDTGPNFGWFDELRSLRDQTAEAVGQSFNYAIVNWYRSGSDFTGWHTDKMDLHRAGSVIAMVSVGATRRFEFRSADTREVVSSIDVGHGSLYVMRPPSQIGYEHSLRPDGTVTDVRISITLRSVLPTPVASRTACAHDHLSRHARRAR